MRKTSFSTVAIAAVLSLMSSAVLAQGTNFQSMEGANTWRASKLPGVAVYGPDNKKVGDVTDVLMDHDGKASGIVIDVGGFLGMGQKDVAVPFDQVKFTDQRMANTGGATVAAGGATAPSANGAATPATPGLGTPGTPAASGMGMTGSPAPGTNPTTAYPDHGTIALTADQLKGAPSFQFAK